MLRVYQSVNAAQAKDYFSKELTQGDYYFDQQEIVGQWGGKAADMLGLSGEVTQEAFNQLVDNINPTTGERLTPHNKGNRRPGYDLTFNAPKSLSVLYEYSKDERLLTAFRDAVHDSMKTIEEAMHTRVRKGGLDEDRQTGNLVYGEFVHFTARPVEEMAPDPHLHAHCFVMNATHDDVEDKWKAGQFGEIKRDAPYYEALFHSHLTSRLSDMGLDIEKDGKFWTIDGIEKDTLDKFSNRTAQIEEVASEKNIVNAKAKDLLGAKLRSAKIEGLSRDALRDVWWDRLDDNERETLDRLSQFEPDDSDNGQEKNLEEVAKNNLDFSIAHHLERQSVIPLSRLKEAALREGFGQASPDDIEAAVAAHDELIIMEQNGKEFATTKHVLQEEREIINFTRKGYATTDKFNPDYVIGKVTDHSTGKSFELGQEQQDVVSEILDSRHRVMAIQGKAGTGKTTTLATLIDGIEQGGGHAMCLAPTADAAYDTLRKDGEAYRSEAMQNANTLARFFKDEKLWKESQGKALIVDEAGLMSVGDMHTLFALAYEHDNRVILMGDTSQHNSVMRGDALRILEDEAGLESLTLEKIRRQDGDYERAVNALSKGNIVDGYNRLNKLDAIEEETDDETRYRKLADKYADNIENGESTLAVAPTHLEGKIVTDAVRKTLKARGHIKEQERKVLRYRNLQLTEAERSKRHKYQVGQMVRYQQNAKGNIIRGSQYSVSKVDKNNVWVKDSAGKEQPLDLSQAKRFSVYEKQEIALSIGDSVRITEGSKTKNGKQLNNGVIHKIKELKENGDIVIGKDYVLDAKQGNINHGYVTTSHASQGKTVQHVLIAQSSAYAGASSMEQFYVSVSRGKKSVEIFTDDKEALLDGIKHSHQRISATELTKNQPSFKERMNDPETLMSALEFCANHSHFKDANHLSPFRKTAPPANTGKWQQLVKKDDRGFSRE